MSWSDKRWSDEIRKCFDKNPEWSKKYATQIANHEQLIDGGNLAEYTLLAMSLSGGDVCVSMEAAYLSR